MFEVSFENVIEDMRDVILEYEQGFVKNVDDARELLERIGCHCYAALEDLEEEPVGWE